MGKGKEEDLNKTCEYLYKTTLKLYLFVLIYKLDLVEPVDNRVGRKKRVL